MAYTPDPTNPATPTVNDLAGNMAYEFQALKGYLQTVLASGSNFYNVTSFRNRLKNGQFRICQRIFPFNITPSVDALTLDQWSVYTLTGTMTVNQAVAGPDSNNYSIILTPTPSSGSSFFILGQRIESGDCGDLIAGTTMTISGYYIATTTDDMIGPRFYILTPTSGVADDFAGGRIAASNTMQIEFPNWQMNTWMYFKTTVTLGQDCTAGIEIQLFKAFPTAANYGFAKLQLEKGSVATVFEMRPLALEQELCNRYCRRGLMNSGAPLATAAGQSFLQWVQFGSPMFKVPLTSILLHTETNTGPVGITNATHTGLEVTTNSLAAGVVSFQLGWLAEANL